MKLAITLFIILNFQVLNLVAQLPPNAQALYDSAYAQDPLIVQYAIDNGANIIATPDGNSFYVQWFPAGPTPDLMPVIVSLHGSEGYAFHEFYSWHSQAQLHGCGIIALQWYRPNLTAPYDYFPDDTIYSYLDSALTNISYPSGKALLHGFSRGSARTYAVIFNDIQSGNNYFCTTMSNAGSADTLYPLYSDIMHDVYGSSFFAGKRWNLFCGGLDPNPEQSGCPGMTNTQNWLQQLGAVVDIFIQDPALDHNGFQLPSSAAYKDSILVNYLQCYNGTLAIAETPNAITRIYPNPFSTEVTLYSEINPENVTLTLYDMSGAMVKITATITGHEIKLQRDKLDSGFYILQLTYENQKTELVKLVIVDP
ncbi:MAG: T9SS type A sorting domain-containing protein [Bacteroidetes bacterium]|nr:T9SS type A sorting domain-containing protein [Bacteroidota bacterium]